MPRTKDKWAACDHARWSRGSRHAALSERSVSRRLATSVSLSHSTLSSLLLRIASRAAGRHKLNGARTILADMRDEREALRADIWNLAAHRASTCSSSGSSSRERSVRYGAAVLFGAERHGGR